MKGILLTCALIFPVGLTGCSDGGSPSASSTQEVQQTTPAADSGMTTAQKPPTISAKEAKKKLSTIKNQISKAYEDLENTYQKQKSSFDEPSWHEFVNSWKNVLDQYSSKIESINVNDNKLTGVGVNLKIAIGNLESLSTTYNDDLTGHGLDQQGIKSFKSDYQSSMRDSESGLK